jgi:hypothetical protein
VPAAAAASASNLKQKGGEGGGGVCKQLEAKGGRAPAQPGTNSLPEHQEVWNTELVTIRAAFLYLFNLILVGVSNFCIIEN